MTRKTPLVPPFTEETALQKVQAAEDAWNTRNPEIVALAYSEDSDWRNREEFFTTRCNKSVFVSQVAQGVALPAHEGALGVH